MYRASALTVRLPHVGETGPKVVRCSAKWMEASREITTTLLSGADTRPRTLQLIVDRVCELTQAEAEHAVVLVPAETELAAEEVEELVMSTAVGQHVFRGC